METAYGLSIPRTVEEACDPQRMALLVYDMQVGVVGQIDDGAVITRRVVSLVGAARAGGFRVVYTRHTFLPKRMSGVSALRTAMTWQRVDTVAEVQPFLLRDSAGFDLVPELQSASDELVLDKISMSAFVAPRWISFCATAALTLSRWPGWRWRSELSPPCGTGWISATCR
jgi:nicotinamidase-related amidase